MAIALVVLGSLAAVSPATAGSSQSIVATDGWIASAGTADIKDPRGGTFRFDAVVMVPQGTIEGNEPVVEGGPDLRRPWVSLTESRKDPFSFNATACSALENLPAESSASLRAGQVPDFHVDVRCEDGRGYDFYRLRWKGVEPVDFGPTNSNVPMYRQAWWGPTYVFDRPHYKGIAEWANFRTDGSTRALFSVCGYRDGRADCFVPEGRDPWQHVVINGGWTTIKANHSRNARATCC